MIRVDNKEIFCKKLGYTNTAPCLYKLNFLEKYGIEKYLRENHSYDFVLSSEMLLKKAIESFGDEIDKKIYEDIKERLSRKPGHLFVETGFKRANQPIFALAVLEGKRNFLIDRYYFSSKNEELEHIKNFVKKHYKESNGKLKMWGSIKYYIYKSEWFGEIIIDKDGNITSVVHK